MVFNATFNNISFILWVYYIFVIYWPILFSYIFLMVFKSHYLKSVNHKIVMWHAIRS